MRDQKNRRNRFSSNGRSFRRSGSFRNNTSGSGLGNFNRSRGNQNASKLLEKYSNLAREALSSGDKVLSENYFQHAEHFSRVLAGRNLSMQINNGSTEHKEKIQLEKEENNLSKESIKKE